MDDNGEPKFAANDQKQDGDGPDNENAEQDKFEDNSSTKDVNVAGQHVNTPSPKVTTVDPTVNTASSNDQDSPKDMFTMGASHTLEATHVEFFSDEEEPEVNLGNIINSYTVPTTPNTRIHKDHPIENVIGDVKSSVKTRRMTKPTSEQRIEPTSIAKALSDSSWVEAIQEELLQFKLQQVSGLQVQQKEDGISINQDKYVAEILKIFNYTDVKSASIPVDLEKPSVKDGDADDVDVYLCRSMIGSLMYLTASRPDIMFAGRLLILYMSSLDEDLLYQNVLKKQKNLGKSKGREHQIPQSSGHPYKRMEIRLVHKELGDRMERDATTASSLEAEQDSGNIN
ncbi:hypothetical protein Tco_1137710 [Tanacetum coccineum]